MFEISRILSIFVVNVTKRYYDLLQADLTVSVPCNSSRASPSTNESEALEATKRQEEEQEEWPLCIEDA